MSTRAGPGGHALLDHRQLQLAARAAASKDVREGAVWLALGLAVAGAGVLFDRPQWVGLVGLSTLVAGALQLGKGLEARRRLGEDFPEPALDLADHPLTSAPAGPKPIEDTAHDAARPAWVPWMTAAVVVAMLIAGWFSFPR